MNADAIRSELEAAGWEVRAAVDSYVALKRSRGTMIERRAATLEQLAERVRTYDREVPAHVHEPVRLRSF